jgi:hypothetical protein
MKPQASSAASPHQAAELRRRQEIALAAVAADGPTQVAELLLAARRGDTVAASLAIGPVLRALPGVDWLTAHDLLRRAGIPDQATPLGELDHAQRTGLVLCLAQPTRAPGEG